MRKIVGFYYEEIKSDLINLTQEWGDDRPIKNNVIQIPPKAVLSYRILK